MGHDPDRIGFSWLPPYHDMGLMGTILVSMFQGGPAGQMSPLHFVQSPRRWLEAITHYEVTIAVGPNFSLDMCSDVLADGDNTRPGSVHTRAAVLRSRADQRRYARTVRASGGAAGFQPGRLGAVLRDGGDDAVRVGQESGRNYHTEPHPNGPRPGMSSAAGGRPRAHGSDRRAHQSRGFERRTHRRNLGVRPKRCGGLPRSALPDPPVFGARIAGELGRYLRTGDLGFVRSGELFVTGRIKDLSSSTGAISIRRTSRPTSDDADPAVRTAVAFSIPGETPNSCVSSPKSASRRLAAGVL